MRKITVVFLSLFLVACGGGTASYYYDLNGLRIETPFELEKIELELPGNLAPYVERSETYLKERKRTAYSANYLKYRPLVGELHLQGAVDEGVLSLGGKVVSKTQKELRLNALQGIEVAGVIEMADGRYGFRMLVCGQGLEMWQLIGLYPEDDLKGQDAADNLIGKALYIK